MIRLAGFHSYFHQLTGLATRERLSFTYFLRFLCSSKDSKMKVPTQKLRFTRTSEYAYPPVRGSKLAAGYDLRSAYDCVVPAKGKYICQTDLKVAVPEDCYGRIAPRSGLAVKNFIDVGAGVVDCDYRGLVGVVLFNFGNEDFQIKRGDRIAQFICERIAYPELEEVDSLDETERGENGFGSTGRQ